MRSIFLQGVGAAKFRAESSMVAPKHQGALWRQLVLNLLAARDEQPTTQQNETTDSAGRPHGLDGDRCCCDCLDLQVGCEREGLLLHLYQEGVREDRFLLCCRQNPPDDIDIIRD